MRISDWSSDVCSSDLIALTDVACRYLDLGHCRCTDYANRRRNVPDCVRLTPELVPRLRWLPSTCAYRLVAEGRDLYWWHPLVSGDPETVHAAGVSVRGQAVSDDRVADIEDPVQAWLDSGVDPRSEEHTSELQSLMRISYADFCLKKKKYTNTLHIHAS